MSLLSAPSIVINTDTVGVDDDTVCIDTKIRSSLASQPWSQNQLSKQRHQKYKISRDERRQKRRDNRRCFLLFAPWGDQGLGIQAREYARFLGGLGFRIVIFSHQPAKTPAKSNPVLQASAAEWELDNVQVYYSQHKREQVPMHEITQFVKEYQVTDALLLEVRFKFMFHLAYTLHNLKTRVYAIPNIELVRRSEIKYFNEDIFEAVLCNNTYTREILEKWHVQPNKLRPFPFMITDRPTTNVKVLGRTVNFLLVGGMNSISRKQSDKVVAAFLRSNCVGACQLTVTHQGCDTLSSKFVNMCRNSKNIRLITQHLSRADVDKLYNTHHVVIFCSRAEGIGIALHEAMARGCAVLALGTNINREIMIRNITGWIVPEVAERFNQQTARMVGNDEMVVPTHTFDIDTLSMLISNIATSPSDVKLAMNLAPLYYYHYQLLAAVLQFKALQFTRLATTQPEIAEIAQFRPKSWPTTRRLKPPKCIE